MPRPRVRSQPLLLIVALTWLSCLVLVEGLQHAMNISEMLGFDLFGEADVQSIESSAQNLLMHNPEQVTITYQPPFFDVGISDLAFFPTRNCTFSLDVAEDIRMQGTGLASNLGRPGAQAGAARSTTRTLSTTLSLNAIAKCIFLRRSMVSSIPFHNGPSKKLLSDEGTQYPVMDDVCSISGPTRQAIPACVNTKLDALISTLTTLQSTPPEKTSTYDHHYRQLLSTLSDIVHMTETHRSSDVLRAHAHYLLAKLHLGCTLPIFSIAYADSRQNRGYRYLSESVKAMNFAYDLEELYYEDWLIELLDAIQGDATALEDALNPRHYLADRYCILNPYLAAHHLKRASDEGHPAAQSLLVIMLDSLKVWAIYSPVTQSQDYRIRTGISQKIHEKAAEAANVSDLQDPASIEKIKIQALISSQTGEAGAADAPPHEFVAELFPSQKTPEDPSSADVPPRLKDFNRIVIKASVLAHIALQVNLPSALLYEAYQSHHGSFSKHLNATRARLDYAHLTQLMQSALDKRPPEIPNPFLARNSVLLEHESNPAIYNARDEVIDTPLIREMMQFYHYLADIGDNHAAESLGMNYFAMHRPDLLEPRPIAQIDLANPRLRAILGYMYQYGVGGVKKADLEYAVKLYLSSSNDSIATYQLATIFFEYVSFTQSAIKYLHISAEDQYPHALYKLGLLYLNGLHGMPNNFPEAIKYFLGAAHRGHLGAIHHLSAFDVSDARAIERLRLVVHHRIYLHLSHHAHRFWSTKKRRPQALFVYHLGAALGDQVAQANAAYMYTSAVDANTPAMFNFRIMRKAIGPVDYAAASIAILSQTTTFSKAAERDVRAAIARGLVSDVGRPGTAAAILGKSTFNPNLVMSISTAGDRDQGTRNATYQDDHKAYACHLYHQASDQSFANAHLRLGDLYYYGACPTRVDYNLAALHYIQAASLNDTLSLFSIQFMYQTGLGVARDPHLARLFYISASEILPEIWFVNKVTLVYLALRQVYLMGRLMWGGTIVLLFSIALVGLWGAKKCLQVVITRETAAIARRE